MKYFFFGLLKAILFFPFIIIIMLPTSFYSLCQIIGGLDIDETIIVYLLESFSEWRLK